MCNGSSSVTTRLQEILPTSGCFSSPDASETAAKQWESFPGLEQEVPSARWCAERELCWTLEDYLRRRTNISQWVPRGGLGRENENAERLKKLAGVFSGSTSAEDAVQEYRRKIKHEFDEILASC